VLLIDHCDNCGSGGAQDVMTVVAEILEQQLDDVAIAPIRDAQGVASMIDAGVGQKVRLELGGRTDMPSIGLAGKPLAVEGRVLAITDGEFVVTGPMYTGVRMHLGRTAVLDTGRVQIVVTERPHEPFDLGVFTHAGIDPRQKRYIMLKSRIHYRAGFKGIASRIVECAGEGVTNADLSVYPYRKLTRPIYPLDSM
jgi:microcystin degradation protein MlrC